MKKQILIRAAEHVDCDYTSESYRDAYIRCPSFLKCVLKYFWEMLKFCREMFERGVEQESL